MNRRVFQIAALLAFFAAVLVAALPSSAVSDNPPGAIKGVVFLPPAQPGEPPQPVAGATVKLFKPGGILVGTKMTDENGKYGFAPVAPGPYVLKAFKPDVGHGMRFVLVHPGQIVHAPIKLVP
jgi:hypothetical protein